MNSETQIHRSHREQNRCHHGAHSHYALTNSTRRPFKPRRAVSPLTRSRYHELPTSQTSGVVHTPLQARERPAPRRVSRQPGRHARRHVTGDIPTRHGGRGGPSALSLTHVTAHRASRASLRASLRLSSRYRVGSFSDITARSNASRRARREGSGEGSTHQELVPTGSVAAGWVDRSAHTPVRPVPRGRRSLPDP